MTTCRSRECSLGKLYWPEHSPLVKRTITRQTTKFVVDWRRNLPPRTTCFPHRPDIVPLPNSGARRAKKPRSKSDLRRPQCQGGAAHRQSPGATTAIHRIFHYEDSQQSSVGNCNRNGWCCKGCGSHFWQSINDMQRRQRIADQHVHLELDLRLCTFGTAVDFCRRVLLRLMALAAVECTAL